ncbi:pyruvate-ferredoxin/flavodoxin oxidoreductase [Haloferula luteola]|uniref:Pyruvate-ferredoxin/flavodoxin oxidoreductase n=1 Tax=Haloferula luteola TaxID=595692 RepID=A0A840V4B3_9BACT|nr:pyruvate-ferredoxin/flavodoxin oxidoreductase [Haloferula luteola]
MKPHATLEANEAVSSVACRLSETIAIYPITPSSPMSELADVFESRGQKNIWGATPRVIEMQSEGGASAVCHGTLQAGCLSTTFTSSQGLLLMIPAMYKIAGELTPFVMHVAARSLATHALSIFGDHQDVMSVRQTGFALLASASVQEAQDLSAIAHSATLATRVPFLHFFDGFRTSHEVQKIEILPDEVLHGMMNEDDRLAFYQRALTPDAPTVRGTAMNPDAHFQAREACNLFHDAVPAKVQAAMDRFGELTGRHYHLFDYTGAADAEKVIVVMASGGETVDETVKYLTARGEKVGVIRVRLYRPFDQAALLAALPRTVKAIAVLDRTKEPGAPAEPLHLDVSAALSEALETGTLPFPMPRLIGGRYGISSKEFTPAMVKAVFDELDQPRPKRRFTVGIEDDVTHLSLAYDPSFSIESDQVVRAVFWGLGSDGTVGANRNSIKIIGEETDNFAQGYFVFDSKKSGGVTVSHLRFGPERIRAPYLVTNASFVACHQFGFLEKFDVLEPAAHGATVLLNAPYAPDQLWDKLPLEARRAMVEKDLKVYTINAFEVAREAGMGGRINTVMQTCFFAISGVLTRDEAIAKIQDAIRKTYAKKGDEVVRRNFAAVDIALQHLHPVPLPGTLEGPPRAAVVPDDAPDFVKRVTAVMMEGKGDLLPVSAFPPDGVWPTDTTRWEKRAIAHEIPAWEPDLCIQCNKCVMVCPHAAIRAKFYDKDELGSAPETFKAADFKMRDFPGSSYTIQIAPEDCTGCKLCTVVCPAKDRQQPKRKALNMTPLLEVRETERENFDFFLNHLPDPDRARLNHGEVKSSQFLRPLFEFSGACAGCGETPYLKLLTQLFGDRLLIANATGCSSIYGGNLPTTPYAKDAFGRGPAWANSLFEDNAEFGFGMRFAVDQKNDAARGLLSRLAPQIGDSLVQEILDADQTDEPGIEAQRKRIATLKETLGGISTPEAAALRLLADYLVRKSVWIVGGDGWAYDIGYGGLDHVLAQGRDVNVLVLDTQVYSNTGGQASKATPIGAAAKFAAAGKSNAPKELGLMAMQYGNVYVARVAMGAKDSQVVKAMREAEAWPGPSLIIAYSHCIAHGFDLSLGMDQQKRLVDSGLWTLFRYDPRRISEGQPPLILDSKEPKGTTADFMRNETRFRMIEKINPQRFKELADHAQESARHRWKLLEQMAAIHFPEEAAATTTEEES